VASKPGRRISVLAGPLPAGPVLGNPVLAEGTLLGNKRAGDGWGRGLGLEGLLVAGPA
jgi:hypothetical protein